VNSSVHSRLENWPRFLAPTNQFVDGEVSHARDLVEDKNMENSKREFDLKLIE